MLAFLKESRKKSAQTKHIVEINSTQQKPEIVSALLANGIPQSVAELIQKHATKNQKWLAIGTPWITEGATAWLDVNIRATDRVLEYGGGRSTLWWASKAESVTCVEASPEWTISILLYAYTRPELLKKLRLHFCPAEWNPTFDTGLRDYWKANRGAITHQDAATMERDFIAGPFPDHNIILFDGSVRTHLLVHKMTTMDLSGVDMIVLDNTEGPVVSYLGDALIPEDFDRLDFAAGPKDDIPSHQKGKHITSVFVRKTRSTIDVQTAHPPRMSEDDRKKHMHESGETIAKAQARVKTIKAYLAEKLGLQ